MFNFINQIKSNIYSNTIRTLIIISLSVLDIMKWISVYNLTNPYKVTELNVIYLMLIFWISADFKYIL